MRGKPLSDKLTTILIVCAFLATLTWLWLSTHAATRSNEWLAPVMRAHFVDMGQANATLLKPPCGAMLVEAGAQEWRRSMSWPRWVAGVESSSPGRVFEPQPIVVDVTNVWRLEASSPGIR